MSELYFYQRADDCDRLAREERDPELREMLRDLENTYRLQAKRAMAALRAH